MLLASDRVPASGKHGSVSGKAKDANGNPVAGRVVSLEPEASQGPSHGRQRPREHVARTTRTDGRGRFRFDDVPPGKYAIVVGDNRVGWVFVSIVVEAGKATKVGLLPPLLCNGNLDRVVARTPSRAPVVVPNHGRCVGGTSIAGASVPAARSRGHRTRW